MWRFRSIAILMIYIIFAIKLSSSNEKIKDESEFVPTHEWQVVRKGQPIPKGLHVRMNFETGVTEAKLLDEEGTSEEVSKRTDLSLSGVPQDVDSTELLDTDVIKEALKKIKSHDKASKEPKKDNDNDSNNYNNNKFRSYEQLKEDMASLNLTTKIDAEILDELLKQHDKEIATEKVDVETISRILEDFDYLAHQFDNGLEFVRQHGFQKVIYTNLNSSSGDIKENTLKLFGSLVQNNGKVQIHALETGSIPMILRILNLETNNQVKSSAVFALSCLLRRFPLAQLHFIENGGLSVIIKLLNNAPVKILVKLVTLMNDLLLENIHAVKDELLMEQYKLVNLEKLLLENDWCNYINNLIVSVFYTEPSDHDSIEKCLLSMRTLAKQCNKQFSVEILNTLSNNYKILADNDKILSEPDNGDNFFINIHELCVDILHSTNIKTEL